MYVIGKGHIFISTVNSKRLTSFNALPTLENDYWTHMV